MKLKHISALFLALVMLFTLASCGGNQEAEETSSVHDFIYETLGGEKYSGTYKGDWEDGCPNGEGSFTGEGERGQLTLVGNWSNGQPNGQCRRVLTTDTYVQTYSGDYFFGTWQGTGNLKVEDLAGNLSITYSGEFQDGRFSGQGEKTDYYTEEQAAEKGYSRITYSGGFRDGKYSGQGEETYYQTEEYAAEYGYSRRVFKGTYSDGTLNGEAELTVYYTKEYAAANGIDYVVRSGEYRDNGFSGSQRYTFYKDGKAIEAGTVKDGKYVSDTDKALNDAIYDGLRDAVGDGIMGDLFDIFGPAFYDRYGN